ncbi:CRISPR-associated endonuclease Cas2 [Candidatus Collierbacteria bacterium]|nr:CRISPR-associated endonuclease Cas2 [Candidatus Collierbacteria bacterium]
MGRGLKTSNLISRITGELTTTAMDLVVLSAAFGGGLILFGPSGKDLYTDKKLNDALRVSSLMYKKWNKSSFRRAVGRSIGNGLLKKVEYGFGLTVDGEKRLRTILPEYKRSRQWDGKLWLIAYDIPDKKRRIRDKLRKWLLEIGCRALQESIWLSIKDPTSWIKDFVAGNKKGSIIVSCLGKDGSVGGETLPELLDRVFGLSKLNKEYIKWIESSEKNLDNEEGKIGLAFRYLFLLRRDPMFPKELLPKDWVGDKAMDIFDKEYRSELDISQYLNIRE